MSTETIAPVYFELESNCTCVYFDEDENELPSPDCWGCFEDELGNLRYELLEWQKANGFEDETLIRVQAEAIGWMRQTGYKDVKAEELATCLFIDGDFTIRYTFTDEYKTLKAVRYSHDEPVGTGSITFTKSPLDKCAMCGEVDYCLILDTETLCEFCHERETC